MPRTHTPPEHSTIAGPDEPRSESGCGGVTLLPAPAIPQVKPSDPAKQAIRSALFGAAARVQANDPKARLGDVEGVHRLRTSTRRLRGELRAFRHLLDPEWRQSLEVDLKWLAGALGGVRDLDVLAERLDSAANHLQWTEHEIPADLVTPREALKPLFEELKGRHHAATETLSEALRSERYARLIETILHSADSMPDGLTEEADKPCRKALPPLALEAWKHLKRAARSLEPDDADEVFHEVRKRSKRARYTAELIAPVLGSKSPKKIKRFITLSTRIQDVLGEHQDAVVACEEIRRIRALHSSDPSLVRAAGLLLRDQQAAAESAREAFFPVWKKLNDKKNRRWMHVA